MKTVMALFIKYKYIFFIIFAALFAGLPLLHPGLIPTHDGEYHLIRFFEFDKVLRQGTVYPRWASDLNFEYGIPLLTYVYPLPNYFASLLHLFGASFLDSVKLNMFFALFVGAFFFYLWTREYWGKLGGFTSAVLYTYAPYHFVDIYVRGSVGEVWALALFPGFLWTYTLFAKTKEKKYFGLASIFLALTIFSHNILGLMFFAFVLTYILFMVFTAKQKRFFLLQSFFIIFFGLGISAVFWLPALLETKYVTGLQVYNIAQNFPDMFQLLFPSWGTGFFGNTSGDEMSVQIGVVNLLIVFISTIWLFLAAAKKWQSKRIFFFFLAWFFVLFCLMLSWTLPIWLHVPLLHYFQFPWRLLSLVILVCAFLGGGIVFIFKRKIVVAGVLIIFVIATTYAYTQPAYYMLRNDVYYTSRSNFIDGTNSPGNTFNTIWGNFQSSRPKEKILIQKDVLLKNLTFKNSTTLVANFVANQTVTQTAAFSYFPSWDVTVDGQSVKTFSSKGLLSFTLPKGNHMISIMQKQTPLETISQWVSIASMGVLLVFVLRKKYNKK